MIKVFKIIDSDFPLNALFVPHTLGALQDAMETIFVEDDVIDDYAVGGDHSVTITHEWMSQEAYDALEEWEPG